MKHVIASVVGFSAMVVLVAANAQDTPKYTVKQVMQKAMKKGGLVDKVKGGTATEGEKKDLVDMFTAMHEAMPKKGDPDNWKKMTDALVAAAKSGDAKALGVAANCAVCHKEFKGK
jgi:hypothetical protein